MRGLVHIDPEAMNGLASCGPGVLAELRGRVLAAERSALAGDPQTLQRGLMLDLARRVEDGQEQEFVNAAPAEYPIITR